MIGWEQIRAVLVLLAVLIALGALIVSGGGEETCIAVGGYDADCLTAYWDSQDEQERAERADLQHAGIAHH